MEFSEEFFETFYTEFNTIAIGILFYIWYSMEKLDQPKASLKKVVQTETAPLLGDYEPESLGDESLTFRRDNRNKGVVAVFSAVLAISYATVSILTT